MFVWLLWHLNEQISWVLYIILKLWDQEMGVLDIQLQCYTKYMECSQKFDHVEVVDIWGFMGLHVTNECFAV